MVDIKKGSQIASLIREIHHLLNHGLRDAFKNSRITPPQMMVLALLWENKKMKVSEISKEMHLANSTVSGIIDRLEKQDIVKRVRSEEDKRIVYVELSNKSDDLHEGFKNSINHYLQEIVNEASKEEIEDILTGLNALKNLLSK